MIESYNSHYPYRAHTIRLRCLQMLEHAERNECVRFEYLYVDAFTSIVRSLKKTKATDLG
jgi:hypothetical protein